MIHIIAIGRTTRDSETKEFKGKDDKTFTKTIFDLACDGKNKETIFLRVELVNSKLNIAKGTKLNIVGDLISEKYTNKEGKEVSIQKIVNPDITFLEAKKTEDKIPQE